MADAVQATYEEEEKDEKLFREEMEHRGGGHGSKGNQTNDDQGHATYRLNCLHLFDFKFGKEKLFTSR